MATLQNLGEFEQLVLLAILQLGRDTYTVPILDEIENRTQRQVSHSAVYVALRRLEKKGLVQSRMAAPTNARGGRSRRYFAIAGDAETQLREQRDALLAMWDGLEAKSS